MHRAAYILEAAAVDRRPTGFRISNRYGVTITKLQVYS
jgi:hypothetical protein